MQQLFKYSIIIVFCIMYYITDINAEHKTNDKFGFENKFLFEKAVKVLLQFVISLSLYVFPVNSQIICTLKTENNLKA